MLSEIKKKHLHRHNTKVGMWTRRKQLGKTKVGFWINTTLVGRNHKLNVLSLLMN